MKRPGVPKDNPWQVLSDKTLFRNFWLQLRQYRVIQPAGRSGDYTVVHFVNRAVAIIPVDENGWTWLVGQYRFALGQWSWEIPMGGVPRNETLEQGALRELKEETGLVAEKIAPLMTLHTSNSVTDEEGFVYVATGLSQQQPEPDETEQLEVWHLPLRDAINLVLDGTITDAISVSGLLRLAVDGTMLEPQSGNAQE